jgi:hypothetical protein
MYFEFGCRKKRDPFGVRTHAPNIKGIFCAIKSQGWSAKVFYN